jgi:transcriptional regulator with XRE-family HTH domain
MGNNEEMVKCDFLRKRMIELREKNHKSQSEMAELIGCNKSTLSRAEKIGGDTSYKTVRGFAEDYCDKLHLTDEQKILFLRGEKIIVTDTSALIKNDQLIDELSEEYSHVIVPDIVVNELDSIKDHNINGLAAKAWRILQSITDNSQRQGGNVITRNYIGEDEGINNDQKIIQVAVDASKEFNCCVDIITYDTGFSARLSGDNGIVKVLYLLDYQATKQELTNMDAILKIDKYYADSYDDIEIKLGIKMPDEHELNAYMEDGNTLIISVVRNRKAPFNQRCEKIKWLMAHGADVDKRDCGKHYLPALSHSIQNGDFEIFKFLLHECNANPNIGSRNPFDSGKFHQKDKKQHKNDGNMPLMIAAWDNKLNYVRELCADERTSINQQDGNGFTALIKACYWGWLDCRDILINAGADKKIVDRDGFTAEARYNEYLETGRRKNDSYRKNDVSKRKYNGNYNEYRYKK